MIGVLEIWGFLGALAAQLILILLTNRFTKYKYEWPFVYLTVLATICSLLTWLSIFNLPWLIPTLFLIISLLLATLLIPLNISKIKDNVSSLKRFLPTNRWEIVGLAFLIFFLLYSIHPSYRPDIWDYHLDIAKRITQFGPFQLPILNDTKYFTGIYEFFFLLIRYFTQNDIIVQIFTTSFGFMAMAIPTWILINNWLKENPSNNENNFPGATQNLYPYLILAAILFAFPDSQTIISPKPGIFFIPAGLCLLMFPELVKRISPQQNRHFFWIGLIATIPIAFKLTWAHFCLSFILAYAVYLYHQRQLPNFKLLITGCITGFLILLPMLVKNYILFSNPLHPLQLLFFKTPLISSSLTVFWSQHLTNAHSITEYFSIILNLFWRIPYEIWRYLLVIIPLFMFIIYKTYKKGFKIDFKFNLTTSTFIFFLLLWPFFYSHQAETRMFISLFAIVIIALLVLVKYQTGWRFLPLILLLPIIVNSRLEVRGPEIIRGLTQTPGEFFHSFKAPINQSFYLAKPINKHQEKYCPKCNYYNTTTIADTINGYFLNSQILMMPTTNFNYRFRWTWRQYTQQLKDDEKPCFWRFLQARNVRYFRALNLPFQKWPIKWRPILKEAVYLNPRRQIKYLSKQKILENITKHCPSDLKPNTN